ncbi:MAG: roadblock/LC7 domain-containing protein [Pyrobaculum sp.]
MEERLRGELGMLINRTGGDVNSILLIRRDGLPVAAVAPGTDVKLVAAISALAMGALKRVGEELKGGVFKMSIISYENKSLLIYPVKDLYIIALLSPESNLGLVLLEVEKLAKRLLELI